VSKKHIKVLFLDDEEGNLNSFRAAFRRDYDVYVAQTPEKAFEIIQAIQPPVIISDQRMPRMSGVEFLNTVRQTHPESMRLLITAYADLKDIIDAINRGNIYRFIAKPWSEDELRMGIENAYELYMTRHNLQVKVHELEKTNGELNKFIYSASHDLRAPLMSVLGLVRLARKEVVDSKALEFFGMIDSSVNKLEVFLQNIVDYYQNSRNLEQIQDIGFKALVEDVFDSFRHTVGLQTPQLEVVVRQNAPFKGDEFRIRIVLSNLISNAIKFRKEDQDLKITVEVDIDEREARIGIEDNGIGILEEHLNQLFQMFFRAQSERPGTGLGLYIVKEALQRIGGEIVVKSDHGQGTRFEISIPNQA
jgi:signal transduction histidine kinase